MYLVFHCIMSPIALNEICCHSLISQLMSRVNSHLMHRFWNEVKTHILTLVLHRNRPYEYAKRRNEHACQQILSAIKWHRTKYRNSNAGLPHLLCFMKMVIVWPFKHIIYHVVQPMPLK